MGKDKDKDKDKDADKEQDEGEKALVWGQIIGCLENMCFKVSTRWKDQLPGRLSSTTVYLCDSHCANSVHAPHLHRLMHAKRKF